MQHIPDDGLGCAGTLVSLCQRVEALSPGAIAGLSLCDEAQTHIERAIFPSLPNSFASAITLVPLQPSDFGSCVKAIALGQVITCPDVECDTSFDPVWRKVCLEHGLRAVQSRPILVAGKPRGTFVIAYRQPKPESDWDVALMQFAASAAGEAMEASKRNAAPEAAE